MLELLEVEILIYTITLNTEESVAGKGIDISLVLKRLGIDSIATGITTDEQKVKDELAKENVESHFIVSDSDTISAKTQQALLDYLKENLKMGDIVVIAGQFAKGIDPAYLTDLAALANKKMSHLIIDVPYDTVIDVLAYHPLLIKPNESELKQWFGKEGETLTTKQLIDLAHDLVVKGTDHVLLSLGANGAAIVNLMHAYMAHAPEVDVVDPAGAGEALLATFIAGIVKNQMPVTNLANSIAAAADTVQSKRLTTFETTPDLQREIIARKLTFEEAE